MWPTVLCKAFTPTVRFLCYNMYTGYLRRDRKGGRLITLRVLTTGNLVLFELSRVLVCHCYRLLTVVRQAWVKPRVPRYAEILARPRHAARVLPGCYHSVCRQSSQFNIELWQGGLCCARQVWQQKTTTVRAGCVWALASKYTATPRLSAQPPCWSAVTHYCCIFRAITVWELYTQTPHKRSSRPEGVL